MRIVYYCNENCLLFPCHCALRTSDEPLSKNEEGFILRSSTYKPADVLRDGSATRMEFVADEDNAGDDNVLFLSSLRRSATESFGVDVTFLPERAFDFSNGAGSFVIEQDAGHVGGTVWDAEVHGFAYLWRTTRAFTRPPRQPECEAPRENACGFHSIPLARGVVLFCRVVTCCVVS